MLTFDNSETADKIYGIKNIAYQAVKIGAIRKNPNRIVQCKNCQGYNHVHSSCYRRARCVKCAGDHTTESYSKSINTKPKCVNCGEEHIANYRGCIVAKEMQKRRNDAINYKKNNKKQLRQIVKERQDEWKMEATEKKQVVPELKSASCTYVAKAVFTNPRENEILHNTAFEKITETLEKLIRRLNQTDKLSKMKFDMFENELAKLKDKQWRDPFV